MKRTKIIHNPDAGKGDYTKKELIAILESQGFKCDYSSTDNKGWKKIKENVDFLVIAGGDGTVGKVATELLDDHEGANPPIALLPLGTANNIAKSLGLVGHAKEIISNLDTDKRKKYDVGKIEGVKDRRIFLESLGFGIFPELMKDIKEHPMQGAETPEEELKRALERVHHIILSHQACGFRISIDGKVHLGNYLLVEIMNISSIGPNLNLSPNSDPGDGEFEIVLIPENQREEFASYVSHKINGIEKAFIPLLVKGRDIEIQPQTALMHVDDELIKAKKTGRISARVKHAMMEFLTQ